jgi:DnaJ family protein C protein 28
MSIFGNISDEIIRQAMQAGAFDNLAGKGRPLSLEDNPYITEEWRLAYHLLNNNGYSLPWLEDRREIEADLESAREQARRAWRSGQKDQWEAQQRKFQQQIEVLNRRIFLYNLQAPLPRFHRTLLNFEQELTMIRRLDEAQPPAQGD